jgi:hypothetical protein
MSGKVFINLGLGVFLLTLIAGLYSLFVHYADLPNRLSQHETIVLGQDRFTPGSQSAVRVIVQDTKDGAPLAGAQVSAVLKAPAGGEETLLYSGITGPNGTAEVVFRVPAYVEGEQILRIETRSQFGSDTVERPVNLQRDYRVLLTTDKPLYQPGRPSTCGLWRWMPSTAYQPRVNAGYFCGGWQGQQGFPQDPDPLGIWCRGGGFLAGKRGQHWRVHDHGCNE